MKVCERCGEEIDTRDGENKCSRCDGTAKKPRVSRKRAAASRKATDAVMASLGLVKVRGALGGIYYE